MLFMPSIKHIDCITIFHRTINKFLSVVAGLWYSASFNLIMADLLLYDMILYDGIRAEL